MPRKFVFELTIREGNDEFWESLVGSPGIVEVTESVTNCLADHGYFMGPHENGLVLKRFEWEDRDGISVASTPEEPAE